MRYIWCVPLISLTAINSHAATPTISLPLASKTSLTYAGAFRVPINSYGASTAAWGQSAITLGHNGDSFYIAGHAQHQAIAEFSIPTLSTSTNLADLSMATNIQPFASVLDRPETGNTQQMDTIGGMEYINGELLVNTYMYYDASASTTHTTLVLRDASDLTGSTVGGYHGYQAKAHASRWISSIPVSLQTLLGGTHITGSSSGEPIISRLSVGPSAFAISPAQDMNGATPPSTVQTTTLLDFSIDNIMGDIANGGENYLHNADLTNDLWTHLSHASYGFIIPGTRTYMTIGFSGGHNSGVGYKPTQDNGNVCDGYCSYQVADNYNYYWLWDLDDLLAVKGGEMNAFDVVPYEYGEFTAPFQPTTGVNRIVGGAFDSARKILYLSLRNADWEQSIYEPAPVIIAYRIPAMTPKAPRNITIQ